MNGRALPARIEHHPVPGIALQQIDLDDGMAGYLPHISESLALALHTQSAQHGLYIHMEGVEALRVFDSTHCLVCTQCFLISDANGHRDAGDAAIALLPASLWNPKQWINIEGWH
jgi:hypothetical protein